MTAARVASTGSEQLSRRLVRAGSWAAFGIAVAISYLLLAASPAQAATVCEEITDGFASTHSQAGSDFEVIDKMLDVGSGPVTLAGDCAGLDPISVDDGLVDLPQDVPNAMK